VIHSFWNLVAALKVTVTVFFDLVSTVMELSEMLATMPITCFSFPCANRFMRVLTPERILRLSVSLLLLLRDVAVAFVWGLFA
jgi:hypothetical protein